VAWFLYCCETRGNQQEYVRKALIIIAAVAAYSLLELGLLLSFIVSRPVGYSAPSTYQRVVGCAQFLLIPGLAALWSRIVYGPYGWPRGTLMILLGGSFGVPIAVIIALIAIAIPLVLLVWAFGVSHFLFALLLPVVVGGMAFGLLAAVRKSGKWSVQAEAGRWRAERQSGASPRERQWRIRGIRLASCIPSTMVLLAFLFLPEIWGMLSHLSQPQSGSLPGYEVSIPTTWIVLRHENQTDGRSWVTGLAGRGMVRTASRYDLTGDLTFSSWDIETEPYVESDESMRTRWMPEDSDVISRRVFTIGTDHLTCLDYRPSYPHYGDFPESSAASVRCSDGKRLSASFTGKRKQVAAFYEMLSGITPKK
jgi:hypothetical protein